MASMVKVVKGMLDALDKNKISWSSNKNIRRRIYYYNLLDEKHYTH